jgi:dihydrofolate reductase
MRKILFFMMTSANGFYERGPWEIDWHNVDDEFGEFANAQLDSVDTLLFGRKTYEGMARFWPSPEALAGEAETAKRMNGLAKIVFSRTLERAEWHNTRLVKTDPAAEVGRLKRQDGKHAIVLGSSDLATTLADRGLIDEYRIMVNPIALAEGKPLIRGLPKDLRLRLRAVRTFASSNVLLTYEPAG